MGMPAVLTHFNFFIDGRGYAGEVNEITLPKLARKFDEHRSGGMNAPVDLDMGMQKMEIEHAYSGLVVDLLRGFGIQTLNGIGMRFVGSYKREDTGDFIPVEIVIRGRHQEIDFGKAKAGEKTELKVKSSLTYYKLTVNGETLYDIDVLNMVEIINGVDRLAEARAAINI